MIHDEPVRGGYLYLEQPGLFSLSGLEQVRYFLERDDFLRPPLYHLSGLRPVDGGPGMAAFSMPATGWWRSGAGPFLGGTFAFVADAALGMAVYTGLPSAEALATSELSMNFLRPATPESGTLTARATVIQSGRSQGLSEARVEDTAGRLLAHATSRLVVRELPFEPPPAPEGPPPAHIDYPTPDPFERAAEGDVLPQKVWDETGGLELMQRWQKGELPAPPFKLFTGVDIDEIEEGRVVWSMPASEWYGSSWRTFYGGAVAVLADCALNSAFTTTLQPGVSYGTLDLKINFLRPVELGRGNLVARARIVHRGKTIAVATCDVENGDGKRVAVALSSCMYLPGRPWLGHSPTIDEPQRETESER